MLDSVDVVVVRLMEVVVEMLLELLCVLWLEVDEEERLGELVKEVDEELGKVATMEDELDTGVVGVTVTVVVEEIGVVELDCVLLLELVEAVVDAFTELR